MSNTNHEELFVQAFSELHAEGNDWMYLPDVAQRAASHDVNYMKRRALINKALGFVGINRPELPDGLSYPPGGKTYPLIARMEDEGIVESEFEDGDYPRRRVYKLTETHLETETVN